MCLRAHKACPPMPRESLSLDHMHLITTTPARNRALDVGLSAGMRPVMHDSTLAQELHASQHLSLVLVEHVAHHSLAMVTTC